MLMNLTNLPRSTAYVLSSQGFLQVPQGLELPPLEAQFLYLACCLGWSPDCGCAHRGTAGLTVGFFTIRVIPTVLPPSGHHPGLLIGPSLGGMLISLLPLAPSLCKAQNCLACLYLPTAFPLVLPPPIRG